MTTHTVHIHSGDWPSLTIPARDVWGQESDVEQARRWALERRQAMRNRAAAYAVLAGHDTVRFVDENGATLDCFPVDVPALTARITLTTDYKIRGPRGGERYANSMAEAEAEAAAKSRKNGQRYEITEWHWRRIPGLAGESDIVRTVTYKSGKVVRRWTPAAQIA